MDIQKNIYGATLGGERVDATTLTADHGVGGAVYEKHQGFALETQHYPDSPNRPDFPSPVLRPGEHYFEEVVYEFSAR